MNNNWGEYKVNKNTGAISKKYLYGEINYEEKIIGLALTMAVVSALKYGSICVNICEQRGRYKQCIHVKFKRIYIISGKIFGGETWCDVYWNPDDKCITVR